MAMMFNHSSPDDMLGIGYSYNLLKVVMARISNPVGKPQIIRYKAECACGRTFWCTKERFMAGTEVNKRAGRRVHQCSKKCTW